MLLVQALVNANKAWVNRAGGRWDSAATELEKGTYGANLLFRDLFRSAVLDPVQWYLDFSRNTEAGRILLTAADPKTGFIPVGDTSKVKLTDLARLGGSEKLVSGTDVLVDKNTALNPMPPDCVVLRLQLPAAAPPAGQYLGFLIVDNVIFASVVALL